MNKTVQRRKILLDLRFLKNPTNGFGQLSIDYGNFLLNNPDKYKDLDITLLVPKNYIGKFGSRVKYIQLSPKYKFFPFLFPQFDIVHSTTQLMKYIPISSATHRIMTIHDIYYLYEKDNKKVRSKKKRLNARIQLSDTITVVSKHTLSEVKKHLELENKVVHVNYVGVPDISKDEESKPTHINSDKKFLFTIGQLVPRKNFHVLLDAMKLMPEYDLYICGNDCFEYGEYIKDRIKKEKINNVFVTGKISTEEKIWFYKYCTAFIFPSVFEGFGIPVIDAMRFKKPVISSNLTSLSEIGGKYTFFLENFSPNHIKYTIEKAIARFYNDQQYIEEQYLYGLSYSLDKHVGHYLDMYRNIKLKNNKNILATFENYIKYLKV